MFAVVKTGGKQYRVSENDVILVEKLLADPGSMVELDQVLMLDDGTETQIGTPLVDGARVAATVVDQTRGDKIIVFKKKRRKDYKRTRGHRQDLTVLRVIEILAKGQTADPAKAVAKAPKPAAEPSAEGTDADAAVEAAPAKKAPAKKAAKKAPAKKAAKKAPAKKAAKKTPAKK